MKEEEKREPVRTTVRLNPDLHADVSTALVQIRRKTGKRHSMDAAIHSALELWLQVGAPPHMPELPREERNRIAAAIQSRPVLVSERKIQK